jgi:SprT-like family
MVWGNAHLRECFDLYNARYFDGRLKVERLEFARRSAMGDFIGRTMRMRRAKRRSKNDAWAILINRDYRRSRRIWAFTLLHEMVHVEQCCAFTCRERGVRFNTRMKELAMLGAFDGLW